VTSFTFPDCDGFAFVAPDHPGAPGVSVVVGVPDHPGAPGVVGTGATTFEDLDEPGGSELGDSGEPDHPGAPGVSSTPPEP
jgi:hypothetical protein